MFGAIQLNGQQVVQVEPGQRIHFGVVHRLSDGHLSGFDRFIISKIYDFRDFESLFGLLVT